MKKFEELKEDYNKKYNEELNKTGIFWAFSDSQFEENRTHKEAPIKEYLSVGAGGYIHQSDKEKLDNFFKVIAKELKKDFTSKIDINDLIRYELTNHECYYTGDPSEAIEVVKTYYEDISEEEITKKVINVFKSKEK